MDVGREFSSWESFMHVLDQYSRDNKVVYIIGTCKPVETANKNESLQVKFPTKFKYCFARMLCKHYGNYSSRSAGLRPNQRTCKTGCTSSILVSVNKKRTALVIKEANLEHTHDVSENIFSKYSQNRRLLGEERRMASVLLRAGVPLSKVQEFISNTCNKEPTIKDLQNIKTSIKGSMPDNEHEFAFLTDLDQLMAEDIESVVEIINFDLMPGAIYIQTSEMTARMKSLQNSQIQFVSHQINDGKLTLVSIIGIDKDLNPNILAFCIIIVSAEVTFQYFVETFIRNNSSFCDSVTGIVLDCSKDNVDFVQQMIPQAFTAWSRSYILDKFAAEAKSSSSDIQKCLQIRKELINADSEEEYEKKLKELQSAVSVTEAKDFLRTWDSYKDLWVQYEISSHSGLLYQKSAVEMDYIMSLKVYVKPSMNLSDLIKALLKFDRSEEPEEPAKEQPTLDVDPSCEQYRHLCFPEASQAVICQIAIAFKSEYEIKDSTDMIFVNKKDTNCEYILDVSGDKCTCKYFIETELPCEHIFAWLRFSGKPLYDESLIPPKWQVFGKSITLDAIAESLAQGQVPSSFQHDERLKELQTVLKDTLTVCCSHSYQQMGADLVLLKKILSVMRNCTAHRTKLIVEEEEGEGTQQDSTAVVMPKKRGRGRPSKKDKLMQQQFESSQKETVPTSPPKVTASGTRHNLRMNIKHKFVTRESHTVNDESASVTSVNTRPEENMELERDSVMSTVLSGDGTELTRIITSPNDATDTSLGQLVSVSPESQVSVNITSLEGKENRGLQGSLSGEKFARLSGARHLTDYKKKLQAGYNVETPRRGRKPFSITRPGLKRRYSDLQDDSMAEDDNEDESDDSDDDDGDDEDEDNEENDEDSDSGDDMELESIEAKRARKQLEISQFLDKMPQLELDEVMQVTSMLESPEERQEEGEEMNVDKPPEVLIRACQQNLETVDSILEHIKKRSTGYDKYAYEVAACIIFRASQTGAPIRDLLQTVNEWPSYLPELPLDRPIEGEIILSPDQTLTVCGHKLEQSDMDSLKPDTELSSKALHAYLEILAQKHNSKMFVIPYDVIPLWREGRFSEKIFQKVHFKTFEYLILPIHCGAEFTELERQTEDIISPCWMALVADVQNKTVGVMNPRSEDKYLIAANGYMLQWRRYMQIRSVHTREMLCSWTTRRIDCSKLESDTSSGIMLLMNIEALINNVPPVVMTEGHIPNYLNFVAVALRDMDRETTVLCVGGPACEQMAARDADWLQCENCHTWWHRACANHKASSPTFYCTSCQQRILNIKGVAVSDTSQSGSTEFVDDQNVEDITDDGTEKT